MNCFFSFIDDKEVTGSKHFLSFNGDIIQLDCGMFQGKRQEAYQKNTQLEFSPGDVKAILLSHAHFDHSGALPIMVKNGFNGNIYSTPATRDIANIILFDSAYIQQKDYEYISEKLRKHPDRKLTLYKPLYESLDVIETLRHFITVNYHRPFIPMGSVEAQFYDAGHIPGSSMTLLSEKDRTKIGFSGDLGRNKLPILKDPEILPHLDFLILEGTYGDRLHESFDSAKERLKEIVNQTVQKGGKVIIPAFAVERTQELIYILHVLLQEKAIPEIPIYVDSPMAVNATSIFKIHPECFDRETFDQFISFNRDPFGFENIRYVTSVRESININSDPNPAIIISASGMAENGRILHHLINNIDNDANTLAIVGFMAAHTLGRKLVEHHKEVKIFGKSYKVKATIKTLNAFSAHSDYQEIKEWIQQLDLKRLKTVFLVHGEAKSLINLKSELLSIGINEVIIVESGTRYQLTK